ncbi:MAG: hypothetical protein F4213_20290 [Boseongicola sp. SB0677_bin_26]|nr:hypothetical protein [Boseongicola sp. SB0665_bin_10]MYG28326.1 hypothetical protein [Boseongicola sp. SB0677_bin_26]
MTSTPKRQSQRTRWSTLAVTVAGMALLAGCGGGKGTSQDDTGQPTMQTPDLPDRDTIYQTSTVADLVALGARKLTEGDFRSEIVGKRLRNSGDVDDGAHGPSEGWYWTIKPDGTSDSWSGKGTDDWSSPSVWTFEDGQYCRRAAGSNADYGCSTVYELNGVYRWSDSGDPDSLSNWSVEIGGWDAGALLYDGKTLTARNVAAMRLDFPEGTSNVIDPVEFSMRRTKDGEYVVMLDGLEHTFTRDQRKSWGLDANYIQEHDDDPDEHDMSVSFWSTSHEELDAGHSRGEHFAVFKAARDAEFHEHGTNPELQTFVVIGNPTLDFDFSRMNGVTATYQGGFAALELFTKSFDDFDWDSDDRLRLRSREGVTLTANFANSTISGNITGFRDEDADVPYGVTLTMPETAFSADGFSGDFAVSGGVVNAASYDASFWGPDANHVVGTIGVDDATTAGGKNYAGVGWFGVGKQE